MPVVVLSAGITSMDPPPISRLRGARPICWFTCVMSVKYKGNMASHSLHVFCFTVAFHGEYDLLRKQSLCEKS